jgi:hypothetical protein
VAEPGKPARRMSFRVAERLRTSRGARPDPGRSAQELDTDLMLFEQRYPTLDPAAQHELLVQAMSPGLHWTPLGLRATRLFLGR